uniref:Uncharacterized protein n=1 Tax=Alexandrium catenella TaxID=2925 RepID=A0A7S1MD13_ALECA
MAWWQTQVPRIATMALPWWLQRLPRVGLFTTRCAPRSDADPLRQETAKLLRAAALDPPPGQRFTTLYSKGMQGQHIAEPDLMNSLGSVLISGIPAGMYFSASTKSGITLPRNWLGNYEPPPLRRASKALPGTAYDNVAGVCGRWTTELVPGTFFSMLLRHTDPVTIDLLLLPRCLLGTHCRLNFLGRFSPAR